MDIRILLLLSVAGTYFCYIPRSTIKALNNNLKKDYDRSLKPLIDQSQNVHVYTVMMPSWIMDLDTTAQKLSLMAYFTFAWTDSFLAWNATEYDGIETIQLKYEDVWHPSFIVGVPYEGHISLEQPDERVVVYHNGTVIWTPGTILSVVCVMDITYYPFDTQECSISVSLPYTSWNDVDLYRVNNDQTTQLPDENPQWHFLDFASSVTTKYGEPMIFYSFLFRRRAEFIVYTTIIPLVLLSILNACVILVPVSSGEKGSIAVTLFLSYCVYLTTVATTLPPNSTKPSLILIYMTIVQIFSGLTMLYAILETSLYINGNHKWLLLHCFSCGSKSRKYSNKENDIKHDGGQPEESCSEQVLIRLKLLDYLVFVICLLLNVIVVIVFTVLAVNSIQEKLD